MGCRICRRGHLLYLFGFALAITAFNHLTFGCVELPQQGAYAMLLMGLTIMVLGAMLQRKGP
ncbi:MAG: hypothetical protein C6I00_05925 [Nitratiruptor sp.]|nr:hypothetical protein [Nitratiruptor sp.]NPA83639.1 hypothetical protein [Campylobacterota bacterium]